MMTSTGVPELLYTAKSRLDPLPGNAVIDRSIGMTVVLEPRSPGFHASTAPPTISVVPPFQACSAPLDMS